MVRTGQQTPQSTSDDEISPSYLVENNRCLLECLEPNFNRIAWISSQHYIGASNSVLLLDTHVITTIILGYPLQDTVIVWVGRNSKFTIPPTLTPSLFPGTWKVLREIVIVEGDHKLAISTSTHTISVLFYQWKWRKNTNPSLILSLKEWCNPKPFLLSDVNKYTFVVTFTKVMVYIQNQPATSADICMWCVIIATPTSVLTGQMNTNQWTLKITEIVQILHERFVLKLTTRKVFFYVLTSTRYVKLLT